MSNTAIRKHFAMNSTTSLPKCHPNMHPRFENGYPTNEPRTSSPAMANRSTSYAALDALRVALTRPGVTCFEAKAPNGKTTLALAVHSFRSKFCTLAVRYRRRNTWEKCLFATTDPYREDQDKVTVADGEGVCPQFPLADMVSARTLLAR